MSEHHDQSEFLPPSQETPISVQNNLVESLLISKENTDSVVFSIISQFKSRADFGKKKYGTTLDRDDLSRTEWIQHAQEELMDAILYLEKLKKFL